MAEMSDKERVAKLAEEKRQAKAAEAARQQQKQADEARRAAEEQTADEKKTQEVFDYCQKSLAGYQFKETNHVLKVTRSPVVTNLGVEAKDGVNYVALFVEHINADMAATIALLAARHRFGGYELRDKDRSYKLSTLDSLRDKMLELISGMDTDYMKSVLEHFRGHRRRR